MKDNIALLSILTYSRLSHNKSGNAPSSKDNEGLRGWLENISILLWRNVKMKDEGIVPIMIGEIDDSWKWLVEQIMLEWKWEIVNFIY